MQTSYLKELCHGAFIHFFWSDKIIILSLKETSK